MQRKRAIIISLLCISTVFIASCNTAKLHNGRFPFMLMEKPPSKRAAAKHNNITKQNLQQLTQIAQFRADKDHAKHAQTISTLKAGDIIAFHFSHKEACRQLRKGKIQKLPYDLFRFGHLTIIVPDPNDTTQLKLLQIAMNQAANIDSDLSYLTDKHWIAYRTPTPLNRQRLINFTETVIVNAQDSKKAYDYSGAFGLVNGSTEAGTVQEIQTEYTCCTLIAAALHHAGFKLHSVHRNGYVDIVTPRQVVESWGSPSLQYFH